MVHLNVHWCEHSGRLQRFLPVDLTSLLFPLLSLVHLIELLLVELILHDLLFSQETLIAFSEDMRSDTTRHKLLLVLLKLLIVPDKTCIFLWKSAYWALILDLMLLTTSVHTARHLHPRV